jgi:hypothetical protein
MQRPRESVLRILLALVTAGVAFTAVFAHPGSGIVVDRRGQIYFIDTGQGV